MPYTHLYTNRRLSSRPFTAQVTNHLFKKVGAKHGMDLVSFNMQRGREFGIPGYMEFRFVCPHIRPRLSRAHAVRLFVSTRSPHDTRVPRIFFAISGNTADCLGTTPSRSSLARCPTRLCAATSPFSSEFMMFTNFSDTML